MSDPVSGGRSVPPCVNRSPHSSVALVERAAFVGLHVRKGKVAESFDRHHVRHGLAHQREHPAGTGVEQQGLVIEDQMLVEREPHAALELRRVDAVDPVGNLVDVRFPTGGS